MSLDLEALRMFLKVAELESFTRAAAQLRTTKSRISLRIAALEAELGTQLFSRTTRVVRLTTDGEQLLARGKRLLAEADELTALFQTPSGLRGSVRIDLPVGFARRVIVPRLPELLALHPQLEISVSATDRRVEVVREGFDCVLSVGSLRASELMARKLGVLPMANCASPGYLRKYGTPSRIEDLERHYLVHYSPDLGADTPSFEYWAGDGYRQYPMRSLVTVNSADAYSAACAAGLGIVQVPRWGAEPRIARGEFVEILHDYPSEPMPVWLVHSHGKNVPRRVRVVMTWIRQLVEPYLSPQ